MARVLSESVTNAEGNLYNATDVAPGFSRSVVGVAAPAAAQADTDTIHFLRVKSNWIIEQVLISAADATVAGAMNVGLYDTAENGGAVVDADLFASALDLAAGPYNNADITHESGEYTYAESEKPLWEVLGLAADPIKDYDLVGDISTTFNGGPTSIKMLVRYRQ